eukprot:519790-Prorocentrum_lima.AAC.1
MHAGPSDGWDRFTLLGLAYSDTQKFYPWLIRATHGHGMVLDWSLMYLAVSWRGLAASSRRGYRIPKSMIRAL